MENATMKRDSSAVEEETPSVDRVRTRRGDKKPKYSSSPVSAAKQKGKSADKEQEVLKETKPDTVNGKEDESNGVIANGDEDVDDKEEVREDKEEEDEDEENMDEGEENVNECKEESGDEAEVEASNQPSKILAPFLSGTLNIDRIQCIPYILSLHLAKNKLPFTDGESFLLPAIITVFEIMIGPEAVAPFKDISCSSDVIRDCISELATDVRDRTLLALKESDGFVLLLDESTDSAYGTHLLVYARFLSDGEFCEEFLFSRTLSKDPTGEEVFSAIYSFFRTHDISWTSCIDVCTDSTAFLTGLEKDPLSFIKAVNSQVTFSPCLIHRQKMASKDILSLLSTALTIGIRVINLIKTRPLDPDFREALWADFQGEFEPLLLNSDTRWLSHGRALGLLFEHKVEVLRILNEMKNTNLASYVQDGVWLLSIAYMADLFDKINELNASLKNSDSNILILHDRIDALKKKLGIWATRLQNGSSEMFPLLTKCIKIYMKEWNNVAKKLVCGHLPQVANFFSTSFRLKHHFDWIRNPFLCDSENQNDLSTLERDELVELSSNRSLKLEFQNEKLETFWLKQKDNYPLLYKKAIQSFLPFHNTALCDRGFANYVSLLNNFDQDVHLDNYLILNLSNRLPDFKNRFTDSDEK